MEKANKKLIILDCDGVLLLDTDPIYESAIGDTICGAGIDISPEELTGLLDERWGSPPKTIAMDYIREKVQADPGLLEARPDLVCDSEDFYDWYIHEEYGEEARPLPGLPETLGRLAGKYTLALNTAAEEEVLFGKVFPRMGLKDKIPYFQGGILTAKDYAAGRLRPKPEPDSTRELMSRNQVTPAETVMVGDSLADVLTALSAGVSDVVVPLTGKTTAETAEIYRAEFGIDVISDLTQLESVLGSVSLKELIRIGS